MSRMAAFLQPTQKEGQQEDWNSKTREGRRKENKMSEEAVSLKTLNIHESASSRITIYVTGRCVTLETLFMLPVVKDNECAKHDQIQKWEN